MVCSFSTVLLIIAAAFFASAVFPQLPVRWHNDRWSGNRGVPMSAAGRIGFGIFVGYFYVCTLIGAGPLIVVGAIPILIGMGIVHSRDRRKAQAVVQAEEPSRETDEE